MRISSIKVALTAFVLSLLTGAVFAADIGVSVRIGDPNFYGQIELGDRYRPRVIYEQPIIVHRARYAYPPMYLRVPPGHAKHWNRHCDRYGACARPVYFVQDRWYYDTYRRHDKKWRKYDDDDYRPRRRHHHDDDD